MVERVVRRNNDGVWRDDGGAVYEIHEQAVSCLRIEELAISRLWNEFMAKQKDPKREPNPWWNCANIPPKMKTSNGPCMRAGSNPRETT